MLRKIAIWMAMLVVLSVVQITSASEAKNILVEKAVRSGESPYVLKEIDQFVGKHGETIILSVAPIPGSELDPLFSTSAYQPALLSDNDVLFQSEAVLILDEPATGTLDAGTFDTWMFSPETDITVQISLTSDDFDAVLAVYNADGTAFIKGDDDGGTGTNATIQNLTVTANESYQVQAHSYAEAGAGDYSLVVSEVAGAAEPVAIEYGQSLEGDLPPHQTLTYAFAGESGDRISVTMQGNFDGFLSLVDEDGVQVASDDDSGGNFMPRLENIPLPKTGTYYLLISSYDPDVGGTFTITLTKETGTVAQRDGDDGDNTISYGETVAGDLQPGSDAEYVFEGAAGDVVTISAEAEFDGYLDLYDPAGDLVISDDDSGEGFNPVIEAYTLMASGQYKITYSSFGGQGRGPFTLTLTQESDTPPPTETPPTEAPPGEGTPTPPPTEAPVAQGTQPVAIGDRVQGSLGAEGVQSYAFEGSSGDLISVAAAPTHINSDLDLYIELRTPSGAALVDDDSGWRFNPALVAVSLPETGSYTLEVHQFGASADTAFLLSLDYGEIHFGPDGQPAQELRFNETFEVSLNANGALLYSFFAIQQENITIELTGDLSAEIYAPASSDFTLTDSVFVAPEAASYVLVVFSESGASGTVTATRSGGTTTAAPDTPREIVANGALLIGNPVEGLIEGDEIQYWTFTSLFPGTYNIILESIDETGTYDPYLRLLDEAGNLLAEDDDSGGNFNAMVAAYPIQSNQTVIIEVSGFAGQIGGRYKLSVLPEEVANAVPVPQGELNIGTTGTVALDTPGQQATFTFTVTEDTQLSFHVTGLTLPYIEIYDEEGQLVVRSARAIPDQKLLAGTYTVVVYDRLFQPGEFTLEVTSGEE